MINKEKRIIIEDQENDFLYEKNKSNLDIDLIELRLSFLSFLLYP